MTAVSAVMATRDRPELLELALRYFAEQEGVDAELVVVDDSADPGDVPLPPRVSVVRMAPGTPLGTKLNEGIARSVGAIVAKLDDDDYYAPDYLATMERAVRAAPSSAVAFLQPFWFLDLRRLAVVEADPGRCAGSTLTFRRALWQRTPFRDVAHAVDAEFLADHGADCANPRTFARVDGRGRFLAVRHGSHTWTAMPWGEAVDDYLRRMPRPDVSLEQLLPAWALERYAALRERLAV